MSRLVQPVSRDVTRGETKSRDADEYQDRVAKYIPAEVVGGYVSLDGISANWGRVSLDLTSTAYAQGATPSTGTGTATSLLNALLASLSTWPGIIFVFCLVLAPLYIWTLARRSGTTVWKAQAFIAALAFVVWAYAIKGNIFFSPGTPLYNWAQAVHQKAFYQPEVGAALLVLFSLAVAFYQPKAK